MMLPYTVTKIDVDADDADAMKDSRRCEGILVIMDIVHAIINTILLALYTESEEKGTTDSFWWYNLVATILSYNGILFNIAIRNATVLRMIDGVIDTFRAGMSCVGLGVARREFYINVGSWFPTVGMMIYGQIVIWGLNKLVSGTDPLGCFAWFTAWLYVVKTICFSAYIVYLHRRYRVACDCSCDCCGGSGSGCCGGCRCRCCCTL